MRRRKPMRHRVLPLIVIAAALTTGCHPAMTTQSPTIQPPPETLAVPLRFASHNFAAHCYNTLSCKVIYDNYDFTPYDVDAPAQAPSSPNYRAAWMPASYIVLHDFRAPAEVEWKSLDGVSHEAKVDMAVIFKDHLIWHKVPKSDMADFFRGPVAGSPSIFLEVNNHTINVYMGMFIPTRTEQIPGNKDSDFRDDLFLVWTRTY
ncbi:MAG TPA: hypothetical protein VN679_11730 [Candidatus Acidoferrales bacterium]|nr:hypothetical protein [Candidatus Acidoferrales bacterium]